MLSRGHSRCSCLRRRSRIIIYNSRYWQSSAGIVRDDTFVGARWEDDSSRPTGGPSSNTTISDLSIDTNLNRNGGSSALLYTQQKHLTTPWSSCQNHRHQLQNTHNIAIRHNSSSSASSSSITEQLTSILPPTPEYLTNATIWGATGLLLTNFHIYLHLPYWACISLTNVCVRSAMIPIAIRGAKTSVKFGNISPEVQYLITNFTNDMRALKMRGIMSQVGSFTRQQSERGQRLIIKTTWQSLRGLFRMNKVNLLDIFKSPALQIPVFWYFAVDIRKIIEGTDPHLAQQLVESSFFWITDLTEPDPWYALPIATGALLYLNVETAVGKKALSGETSSRSNVVKFIKDAFQTLAIFMPCFMAQQPSGVQLYLATSMVFTLLQSNAMRNDTIRQAVGLPPMHTKSKDQGTFLKEFAEIMEQRQKAKALGGFVPGEGVHLTGANTSHFRIGKKRKSTIVVEKKEGEKFDESKMTKIEFEVPVYTLQSLLVVPDLFKRSTPVPFLPGIREPVFPTHPTLTEEQLSMPEIPLDVMEAANRGEKPIEMAPKEVLPKRKESKMINVDKLKKKGRRKKGKQGKK